MARGSGFNTAIRIVKAIDRAQKKAERKRSINQDSHNNKLNAWLVT